VVVSPLAVSDSVRANLPSLYWLAVNGFRGERGGVNNLADIRTRYAALETQYGTPIDETIAIMATKVAVWNFTDSTFALLSTSLVPDPANPTPTQLARYKLMVALVKSMVADARADGHTLSTTTLDVTFNNSTAVFTAQGGDWYYGPITANAASSNGTGTPEKIYLTKSGMYAADLQFWHYPAGLPILSPLLNAEPMYGSQDTAPYVSDGDQFYVRIPASATSQALVNIGQPNMNFSYLALHGLARSADVTYTSTPAIMAWQGTAAAAPTGVQDWGHVQAFIGYVDSIQASLYGEGHLLLKGNSDNASLTVSKAVLGATDTSNAGSFPFALEVFDNSLQAWVPVPLFPGAGGNISGSSGLSDASPGGLFSLIDGGSVSITGLPAGRYRVSEQESVDGYSAVHQLSSNAPQAGFSAEAVLGGASGYARSVVFTNTIIPHAGPQASIVVNKVVRGSIGVERFPFTLEVYSTDQQAWLPVALDPAPNGNITGDSGLTAPSSNGVFSLKAGGTVSVINLPLGRYRLTEGEGNGSYTAVYQLDSGSQVRGFATEVPLSTQGTTRTVTFTNTKAGSVVPATGDNGGMRLALLAGILITGGIGVLVRNLARKKVLST
jgi:hypothetical protein